MIYIERPYAILLPFHHLHQWGSQLTFTRGISMGAEGGRSISHGDAADAPRRQRRDSWNLFRFEWCLSVTRSTRCSSEVTRDGSPNAAMSTHTHTHAHIRTNRNYQRHCLPGTHARVFPMANFNWPVSRVHANGHTPCVLLITRPSFLLFLFAFTKFLFLLLLLLPLFHELIHKTFLWFFTLIRVITTFILGPPALVDHVHLPLRAFVFFPFNHYSFSTWVKIPNSMDVVNPNNKRETRFCTLINIFAW